MKTMIDDLLRAAKAPTDNPIVKMLRDELPANAAPDFLDCQVVLKSGYSMAGILTRHSYVADTLRLVAIGKTADNKVLMADHYFTYDDVQTIVLAKPLPEQLVQGVRKPLIVPGS